MRRAKLRSELLGVMDCVKCIVNDDDLTFCNKQIYPAIAFGDGGLAQNAWF